MFDIDQQLRQLLQALSDKKLISRDCLDEIEGHLRDEIDDLIANGSTPAESFAKASQSFGRPQDLVGEYHKLFGRSRLSQFLNVFSHYFDRRAVVKALVGLGLGSALMLAGLMLEGGHLSSIIDIAAFCLVAGATTGMSLLNLSWRQIVDAYSDALNGKPTEAAVFKRIGRNALSAGLVGAFSGIVQIVRNLSQPDQIGPALALALMCLLYGFLAYLIFGLGFETAVVTPNQRHTGFVPQKRSAFIVLALAAALYGSLRLGLGSTGIAQFLNLPAAITVVSGVLFVGGFARRFSLAHLPYLANGALSAGVIGVIFNVIHVMENLDKPQFVYIGLSVALLPGLYAALVAVTLRSIGHRLQCKAIGVNSDTMTPVLMPYYAAAAGALVLSTALVIYALSLSNTLSA